jgi:Zn-dependent peptidase ImmA (M78 family)
MRNTYSLAEHYAKKLNSRNPYELLDFIGANTKLSYEFDPKGLKGFAVIMNKAMFAVINGHLPEEEQRIVAGHEAAHLILHKREILSSPACSLQDFEIYSNTGRLEQQANTFLADFLISDEQLMAIASDTDKDYFAVAKELYIPPPLLAFKLFSMIQRGFDLRNPGMLHSRFLGRKEIW